MQSFSAAFRDRMFPIALALACFAWLPGCAGVVLGGGGVAGMATAQERRLESGARDVATASEIRSSYLQTEFAELFLNVNVLVVEGRVLLTGTVESDELRTTAVYLARQTDGATEVLNEIQVGPEYGITVRLNDTRISTEIRARLLAALGTDQIDFWTTTHDGVVYLVGIAESKAEIQQVTDVARTVKSARKFVNHIILHDDPRRSPEPDAPGRDTTP